MKWLNKKIIVVSFIWWLLQGVLLLLNELRVLFEYDNYSTFSFFVLGVSLIVISLLLWYVKDKTIILLLSTLLLIYSITQLFFFGILLFFFGQRNNWNGLFLLIPIFNILLSIFLMLKNLSKEIKE